MADPTFPLRTERLLLRPLTHGDLDLLHDRPIGVVVRTAQHASQPPGEVQRRAH